MFLLVPADPGCPEQNPKSRKTVACVSVCYLLINAMQGLQCCGTVVKKCCRGRSYGSY